MKTFLQLLFLVGGVGFFFSCDFDQLPSDAILTERAWKTVEDARHFRIGMYSEFQKVSGGPAVYLPDYQSDLYNLTISSQNRGAEFQRWDFTSFQKNIEYIWQQNYVVINNCNHILLHIDEIIPESEQDKTELDKIKGEAYLMRALCYHSLVLRFAKDYEPEEAEHTLGLPLVTEVDPEGKPARSSLEDTYRLIKEDIQAARSLLLPSEEGTTNSIYFTTDVIDAFEARVDLYMHDYPGALKLSYELTGKYVMCRDAQSLADMWENDEGIEILFQTYCSVDERNEYCSYPYFLLLYGMKFHPDIVPSQWVLDLYEESDIRKIAYFQRGTVQCNYVIADNIYMLRKFPGNPSFTEDADYGYPMYYNMSKLFRSPELYLIMAEAFYRVQNEEGALAALNMVRIYRQASILSSSGEALFNDIKNEWIREFVGEGHRLDDLKRWHDDMYRRDPQDRSILVVEPANLYHEMYVPADDPRWVWEIPANDLNTNPNLEPNWK